MVRWTAVPVCPDCGGDNIMGYNEEDESWECTECDTVIDDEEFDDNQCVSETETKYFMISTYEKDKPLAFAYPDKHSDLLIPVQAYGPENQPILIIYQFDYTNNSALERLKNSNS